MAERKLALNGGRPVRDAQLPYAHQMVGDDDITAVVDVLRSEWLTTGPAVSAFEGALALKTHSADAVVVSSGTAALHAALHSTGIGPGDEVIVPAMTFAASGNAAAYLGATPRIADVEPDTLLINPDAAAECIGPLTKAIVAVDYAGQPCDYDALRALCVARGISLVADGCHSLGATYKGRPVGSLADATAFSFHPVKHITSAEGGAVTTLDVGIARRARRFRNHGMTRESRQRELCESWEYDIAELGYNYRLSDMQCALGLSQLAKLDAWVQRRREIADHYGAAFASLPGVEPLRVKADLEHAFHLYVARLAPEAWTVDRSMIFAALRAEGIGVNVHYIPLNLHTLYRERFGATPGQCPVAEAAYAEIVTLPLFPGMLDQDVHDVIDAVHKVREAFAF